MKRSCMTLFAALAVCTAVARSQSSTCPLSPAPVQLSKARTQLSGLTVGDLVLLVGGRRQDATLGEIDVYHSTTGHWSTASLQVPRTRMASTVVSANGHTYALFAGGEATGGIFSDVVEIYDASLGQPEDPAAWSLVTRSPRIMMVATTVGTKAMFAGGASPAGSSDEVWIYDASVGPPTDPTAWSTATLSRPRQFLAAATAGGKALFGGGFDGSPLADVDVYDDSSGTWSTAMLSQARGGLAATSVGDRVFFGGGFESFASMSAVVDVYDAQSGSWSVEHLSVPRAFAAATSVGSEALFAGGVAAGPVPLAIVDVFDTQTMTWSSPRSLSIPRFDVGITALGNRAFVGGGTIALDAGGRPIPTPVVDLLDFCVPVGERYCVATPNSSGAAATIEASGSASLAANSLALQASTVPNAPFVFFHGSAQAQLPFGDGFLCTTGGLVRLGQVQIASGGVALAQVDLPSAGITAPGVRHFQCWFRDVPAGGAGFNTSDALTVTFVP